jgi:hypothetical protein
MVLERIVTITLSNNMLKRWSANYVSIVGCGTVKAHSEETPCQTHFFHLTGHQAKRTQTEFPLALNVVYPCEIQVVWDVEPEVPLHRSGVGASTVIALVIKIHNLDSRLLVLFSGGNEGDFQITYPFDFMACMKAWKHVKVKSMFETFVGSIMRGNNVESKRNKAGANSMAIIGHGAPAMLAFLIVKMLEVLVSNIFVATLPKPPSEVAFKTVECVIIEPRKVSRRMNSDAILTKVSSEIYGYQTQFPFIKLKSLHDPISTYESFIQHGLGGELGV